MTDQMPPMEAMLRRMIGAYEDLDEAQRELLTVYRLGAGPSFSSKVDRILVRIEEARKQIANEVRQGERLAVGMDPDPALYPKRR